MLWFFQYGHFITWRRSPHHFWKKLSSRDSEGRFSLAQQRLSRYARNQTSAENENVCFQTIQHFSVLLLRIKIPVKAKILAIHHLGNRHRNNRKKKKFNIKSLLTLSKEIRSIVGDCNLRGQSNSEQSWIVRHEFLSLVNQCSEQFLMWQSIITEGFTSRKFTKLTDTSAAIIQSNLQQKENKTKMSNA